MKSLSNIYTPSKCWWFQCIFKTLRLRHILRREYFNQIIFIYSIHLCHILVSPDISLSWMPLPAGCLDSWFIIQYNAISWEPTVINTLMKAHQGQTGNNKHSGIEFNILDTYYPKCIGILECQSSLEVIGFQQMSSPECELKLTHDKIIGHVISSPSIPGSGL